MQRDIGALAERQAAFERRDGRLDVSLAEAKYTHKPQCQSSTVGVFDLFGQPYRIFSHAAPRSDLPQLGKTGGGIATGAHAGEENPAKMRIAQGAGERCHRPLCHVQRLAKAPTVHVHHGQSRLGRHQDVERATGGSQGEGALARRHGVLILVHAQEGETQLAGDPPAPPVIVQLLGEGLGRTQGVQYTGVLIERQQGVAQIAAQVNGLFQRAARLGGAAPGPPAPAQNTPRLRGTPSPP